MKGTKTQTKKPLIALCKLGLASLARVNGLNKHFYSISNIDNKQQILFSKECIKLYHLAFYNSHNSIDNTKITLQSQPLFGP